MFLSNCKTKHCVKIIEIYSKAAINSNNNYVSVPEVGRGLLYVILICGDLHTRREYYIAYNRTPIYLLVVSFKIFGFFFPECF